MKKNIILAGVGGQGILTIASIIDLAAMQQGLFVKQAEVHGMSQRGGAVESHLRIADQPLFSDLIPKGEADLILSLEPMESLRYLPFLAPSGLIVTASEPFVNIPDYPDKEMVLTEIIKHPHLIVDAEKLARQAGNLKTYNMVMLGAASPYLGVLSSALENAIVERFSDKGDETVRINLDAFQRGASLTKG
jgi:indolepyruvate ferredoxin oxidoreductase beta subunit